MKDHGHDLQKSLARRGDLEQNARNVRIPAVVAGLGALEND
jgi:hypothetical protein